MLFKRTGTIYCRVSFLGHFCSTLIFCLWRATEAVLAMLDSSSICLHCLKVVKNCRLRRSKVFCDSLKASRKDAVRGSISRKNGERPVAITHSHGQPRWRGVYFGLNKEFLRSLNQIDCASVGEDKVKKRTRLNGPWSSILNHGEGYKIGIGVLTCRCEG